MELSLADLTRATDEVHAVLPPTPQRVRPLRCGRDGASGADVELAALRESAGAERA